MKKESIRNLVKSTKSFLVRRSSTLLVLCFLGSFSIISSADNSKFLPIVDGGVNGIIMVPGFSHGIALCESERSTILFVEDDSKIWNDGVATYIVSKGHLRDKRVRKLIKLAHTQCKNFKND